MRVVTVFLMCCAVAIQVAQSQLRRLTHQNPLRMRHIQALRTGPTDAVTQQLGPIQLHGVIGSLPKKYVPLTKADEYAAWSLNSVLPDIIQHLPNVYTVNQVGPINIDLPEFWLHGKLYLNNLTVKGVNQAQVQHLEVRLKNDRVDFVIHAPHISADLDFDLEGHVGVVPLHLSGSVSVSVQDLNPVGAVTVKKVTLPVVGEVFQVDGGNAVIDIENVAITLKNSHVGDLDIDADFIKNQVLNDIKDEIADVVLNTVFKEVNKELSKYPAWKVLRLITE